MTQAEILLPLKVEIQSSPYFRRNDSPKLALGQLVKTCLDEYSGSVDVLCVQGIICELHGWTYSCEYLATVVEGNGSAIWEAGENFTLEEVNLYPLTDDDQSRLNQIELDRTEQVEVTLDDIPFDDAEF